MILDTWQAKCCPKDHGPRCAALPTIDFGVSVPRVAHVRRLRGSSLEGSLRRGYPPADRGAGLCTGVMTASVLACQRELSFLSHPMYACQYLAGLLYAILKSIVPGWERIAIDWLSSSVDFSRRAPQSIQVTYRGKRLCPPDTLPTMKDVDSTWHGYMTTLRTSIGKRK